MLVCAVVGLVAAPLRPASTLAIMIASSYWMISFPLTLLGHFGTAMQAMLLDCG